jgi:creatinine amidohydrolase
LFDPRIVDVCTYDPIMFSGDWGFAVRRHHAVLVLFAFLLASPQVLAAPESVQLDELTWTEVRDALRSGTTTVIIPVGGTEQNGPHMALGKHNFRARALAERIATKLGKTLVAPVVAYVPEGRVSPPAGHMRFPGTLSVPDDALAAVLAGASRSLKQHGFQNIVILGDSGNYQHILADVAQRLNREFAGSATRVHHVSAYYRAATEEFAQALRARGITAAQIGTHAALADTSLMLAVDPAQVRPELMRVAPGAEASSGVSGEPSQASAVLGRIGTDLIVDKTVQAIRDATSQRR